MRLQYAENKDRADFSAMERAWALVQMKQAMDDAPWETIEERFPMSRTRRQELLRLLTFTPEQELRIARLRLRETQIHLLHHAVRDGELTRAQADTVLAKLARPIQLQGQDNGVRVAVADGPTIARLVTRAKRMATDQALTPR